MRKMRLLFAACFSANLLALIVTGTHIPTSAPSTCDSMMNCTAIKMLEKKLEDLIALVNKTSNCTCTPKPLPPTPPGPFTAGPTKAGPVSSCKKQYDKNNSSKSQVLTLMFGSQKIPVYCHMGNFGCGDGGWTLAMKIDGNKKTFHYDAQLWSDNNTYNLAGGKTGFDTNETKLPTYWNTSFSKICLGMMIGQQINFVVINQQANSLYSLIADGQYRATSLGRNTWKTLIGSQASLQTSCNKEGFNAMASRRRHSKARIGILGNQENDCNSCDSRIGFGTGGKHDDSNTCGNEALDDPS
ncbi:putative skeletal organic matrix protein 5 isoform X2 [Oculina patagonica]